MKSEELRYCFVRSYFIDYTSFACAKVAKLQSTLVIYTLPLVDKMFVSVFGYDVDPGVEASRRSSPKHRVLLY